MNDIRKFHKIDTYRLLDMFQAAIRKDCKKPCDDSSLKIAEIYKEIAIRCFEEDHLLEKIEKKKVLKVADITKMDYDSIDKNIMDLRQTASEGDELLVLTLLHAQRLFKEFIAIRDDELYLDATDDEKIGTFEGKYAQFYKKYPVIYKYMVCRGVFSLEAFRQFLIKSKNVLIQHKDSTKKDKISTWCELRAFYVQQAWKLMHNGRHYSTSDSLHTYEEVFRLLMEDHAKFEEDQEKATKEIESNELNYKLQAIEFAINNADPNDGGKGEQALEFLEELQSKALYSKVMGDIKNNVSHMKHHVSGYGTAAKGVDLSSMIKADDY